MNPDSQVANVYIRDQFEEATVQADVATSAPVQTEAPTAAPLQNVHPLVASFLSLAPTLCTVATFAAAVGVPKLPPGEGD